MDRKLILNCLAALVFLTGCGRDGKLPRQQATPQMETAFADYLQAVEDAGQDIHSIMILQHGKVVEEKWMGEGHPDSTHIMNSVSKTFTATAVGLAISEGRLKLEDKVVDFFPGKVEYEDAVAEVADALSVLGEEYVETFMSIITSGHVDVYPTDTKRDGAFEWQLSDEYLPWLLFNYNGYSDDVSTIAHEGGHATYDALTTANQPRQNRRPTIFTQEVASTTNELLYYTYKMNHAEDDEEKLYYLENVLSMFSGTFFSQMWYAEFEDYMYQIVESGSALDPEVLGDKWMELLDTYRGDAMIAYPDARYAWSEIPHFYYVYYVYQYASSVCYASSIAEGILSGEEGAVEDYLTFLKLGRSDSPQVLLSAAGIDPLSEDTYRAAMDYFRGLVDEYDRLVDAKLSAEGSDETADAA